MNHTKNQEKLTSQQQELIKLSAWNSKRTHKSKLKKWRRQTATCAPMPIAAEVQAWPDGPRRLFMLLVSINKKKHSGPVWIQNYGLGYFAKVFEVERRTIQRWFDFLIRNGLVFVNYKQKHFNEYIISPQICAGQLGIKIRSFFSWLPLSIALLFSPCINAARPANFNPEHKNVTLFLDDNLKRYYSSLIVSPTIQGKAMYHPVVEEICRKRNITDEEQKLAIQKCFEGKLTEEIALTEEPKREERPEELRREDVRTASFRSKIKEEPLKLENHTYKIGRYKNIPTPEKILDRAIENAKKVNERAPKPTGNSAFCLWLREYNK